MPSNKVKSMQGDQEYKGEPLDAELANGPMTKRSCTDPLCCLIFIAFIAGMIGIAGYALTKGNPTLIGRGYDADGKMCGVDSGYENYPYLYWPLPGSQEKYRKQTVCIQACPQSSSASLVCKTNSAYSSCTETQSGLTNSQKAALLVSGNAPITDFYVYDTLAFLKRFCIPQIADFSSATQAIFNSEVLEQWVSDIRQTWPVILASMGLAFIIGVVYMIFLRYCSGVLTWTAIFCFIGGMAGLGYIFYKKSKDTEDDTASTGVQGSDTTTNSTINSEKIIAYVCWAVAGLTFIAVLCLWNRIRLAIAILKSAAEYVKDTPTIFIVPVITILTLVCFFGYWGLTAVYLVSSGDASQIKGYPFGDFQYSKTLQRLLIYHVFGLLWFNAFVIASTQFVLASSTALWYFSQGTGQAAPKTVKTSIYRLVRYHLGSIAFGSLILAIVQMIRLILAYMEAQAKKLQGKEGRVVKYALRCLQCYVACFERFIKFLNKNAYIQVALTGKNFCSSAKAAFFLILRNPLRFGIVGGIGSIFVLFGKVFIAAITALAGFLVITKWDRFNDNLYSPFIPTICIFIFAYVIGAVFMNVYGMAADTILACFIVDEEIHSKKNSPALHCPESLKTFLEKNKKN
jgi:hypothetical protein